jgi:recombination protein RecA
MASEEKKRRLEMTVAALQDRWGVRAVRRLREKQALPIPHVPTGFPQLDEALGIGGLPRGRISEIVGAPTSGIATITLKIVASAQKQAGTAIYIDPEQTFDPDYAARCGVQLSQLVLVRPYNMRQALSIVQDFILGGDANILVFDTPFSLLSEPKPAQSLATALGRLIAPLSRTNCALLFLTSLPPESSPLDEPQPPVVSYPNSSTLPHYAAVRLFIQRERWIYRQQDIRGYQAQIVVAKNKLGAAGKRVSVSITFNGTVAGRP